MRKVNWTAQQAERRRGIKEKDIKRLQKLKSVPEPPPRQDTSDVFPATGDDTEGLFFFFLKRVFFIAVIFFAVLCWLVLML